MVKTKRTKVEKYEYENPNKRCNECLQLKPVFEFRALKKKGKMMLRADGKAPYRASYCFDCSKIRNTSFVRTHRNKGSDFDIYGKPPSPPKDLNEMKQRLQELITNKDKVFVLLNLSKMDAHSEAREDKYYTINIITGQMCWYPSFAAMWYTFTPESETPLRDVRSKFRGIRPVKTSSNNHLYGGRVTRHIELLKTSWYSGLNEELQCKLLTLKKFNDEHMVVCQKSFNDFFTEEEREFLKKRLNCKKGY